MFTDQQGHQLTNASAESLALYQQGLTAFHLYQGDPLAALDGAAQLAPDFAMARIAKMVMLALFAEPAAIGEARGIAATLEGARLDEREQSFYGATAILLDGHWADAKRAFDRHNIHFPRDLLALQCGHLLDFYCADSRNLRERVARALPLWDEHVPGYSLVLGMYAFGLEEDGRYGQAEETGRQALELEPFDCWAHHAVAHVMEMQGRPEDGIGWMLAREPFWSGDQNFFKVHNWWHRAVFHLDLGQAEDALALYDGAVRQTQSAVVLDMIDASALLWRLHLAGVDVGERWRELAALWQTHADGRTYPFNDWHAAMAYLGAGREDKLETLVNSMKEAARQSPVGDWVGRVGLPLVEGFADFWYGDYASAVERLFAARRFAGLFGGSHAQRDIIDLTLLEAALRGSQRATARALVNERLTVRPHSHMARGFLHRAENAAPAVQPAAATMG